jgi:hypothetical protein
MTVEEVVNGCWVSFMEVPRSRIGLPTGRTHVWRVQIIGAGPRVALNKGDLGRVGLSGGIHDNYSQYHDYLNGHLRENESRVSCMTITCHGLGETRN